MTKEQERISSEFGPLSRVVKQPIVSQAIVLHETHRIRDVCVTEGARTVVRGGWMTAAIGKVMEDKTG